MSEEKIGSEPPAELHITTQEARNIASLLRYVVSLNTTVGLVSPTGRRITTPTYRAIELAALVFEGKTFEKAAREAETIWTDSLEENYRHALDTVRSSRKALQSATTGLLRPEQFAEYLEISQEQFLEIVKSEVLHSPTRIFEE
jgi:hypothetical protein